MTEGEERVQYKNIVAGDPGLVTNTAVATKLGLFTVTGAAIVLACVSCEIGKQVSNYSINYYNGGRYPLPQTLLVSVLRVESFIIVTFSLSSCCRWWCWSSSSWRPLSSGSGVGRPPLINPASKPHLNSYFRP